MDLAPSIRARVQVGVRCLCNIEECNGIMHNMPCLSWTKVIIVGNNQDQGCFITLCSRLKRMESN